MITTLARIEEKNAATPVHLYQTEFDASVLVEKYGNFLYRYAMMRVHDANMAEDLVQETLLAALKDIENFACKSSKRAWLTGILKNKIVDYFRKSSREAAFDFSSCEETLADKDFFRPNGAWNPEHTPSEWSENPDKVVENREFWQVVRHCLEMLPKRTAAAFTLREIEGFSSDEVCQTLNISPNNLWVMLHRARLQLRHEIEVNFFAANK